MSVILMTKPTGVENTGVIRVERLKVGLLEKNQIGAFPEQGVRHPAMLDGVIEPSAV